MLKLLSGLFEIFGGIFEWLKHNQLIKAGEAQAHVKQLEKNSKDVEIALEARDKARIANASVPVTDSLPDDGFLRRE